MPPVPIDLTEGAYATSRGFHDTEAMCWCGTGGGVGAVSGNGWGSNKQLLQQQRRQQHHLEEKLTRLYRTASENQPNNVDDVIANALSNLSKKERERVYQDIHGVVDETSLVEDPKIVQRNIQDMKRELERQAHPGGSSDAYLEAIQQDRAYVEQEGRLTSFLRADEWNPNLAARRMIGFFEEKKRLWGAHRLTKDITLDDFDGKERDWNNLKSGIFQHVPLPDRSGRRIIIQLPPMLMTGDGIHIPVDEEEHSKSLIRPLYYVFMAMTQDNVLVQQQGVVEIGHQLGVRMGDNPHHMQRVMRFRNVMPIKAAAAHVCTDDPTITMIVKLCGPLFDKFYASRLRIHCGPHLENQYKLLSCGIPLEALPIDSNGAFLTQNHQAWLQKRRALEQQQRQIEPAIATMTTNVTMMASDDDGVIDGVDGIGRGAVFSDSDTDWTNSSGRMPSLTDTAAASPSPLPSTTTSPGTSIIYHPTSNDVLLGRGKAIDLHEGNIKFRKYLQEDQVLSLYRSTPKQHKYRTSEQIRQELVDQYQMRFLKAAPLPIPQPQPQLSAWSAEQGGKDAVWVVADAKTVQEKISRTCRRLLGAKTK